MGFRIYSQELESRVVPDSPILERIQKPFDFRHFQTNVPPLYLGDVDDQHLFGETRLYDCTQLDPIREPGFPFYEIDESCRPFEGIIRNVLSWEHAINPAVDEYFVYLTINQNWIGQGEQMLQGGWHVDGTLNEAEIRPWLLNERPDHLITVSNCVPTEVLLGPLDIHSFDDYKKFNRVSEYENMMSLTPFGVYLLDDYHMHRAGIAPNRMLRTFFRIGFRTTRYDPIR